MTANGNRVIARFTKMDDQLESLNHQFDSTNQRITCDLDAAAKVQQSLLQTAEVAQCIAALPSIGHVSTVTSNPIFRSFCESCGRHRLGNCRLGLVAVGIASSWSERRHGGKVGFVAYQWVDVL